MILDEERAQALVAARTDHRRIITALASLELGGLTEDVCAPVAWLKGYEKFAAQLVEALASPHREFSGALCSISADQEVMAALALKPVNVVPATDGVLAGYTAQVRRTHFGLIEARVPYAVIEGNRQPFVHYSIEWGVVKGRRGTPVERFTMSCRWQGALPQRLRDVVGWGGPDERIALATLVLPPERSD
jgi:hypothetical protein